MKQRIVALCGFICLLAVNCVAGALGAIALGCAPIYGIAAVNGVAIVSGILGGLTPAGNLCAGLYTEAWTGFMSKAFRTDPEGLGWYSKIRSFDQYVNNDVIHFVNIGGDPTVLVNNTSYPLEIETLADGDKAVSLDKYQTKPTQVTDDEIYALTYDKMATVIERHKEAIDEKKYSRAIHAISPTGNSNTTPVLLTTGETSDGRKALTRKDIIRLKKAFDKNKVPKVGRILVLCSDHIADLLDTDQKFSSQYYDYTTGKVNKLYGFDIYEYDDCPYYNVDTLKKTAYGSVPAVTDKQASIAFSPVRMMKANGSVTTYASEAKSNPTTQANLVSFRTYSICLPLKEEAMGAIVSAKV
ncbi:MAG: phage capsid protein [Muribaculaceae bacterium]